MDERERIRRELEEQERLDAIDPLRALLHAGTASDDEDDDAHGQGEAAEAAEREQHPTASTAATAEGQGDGGGGGGGGDIQLRYKLHDGNDVVPAQRAAVEGDVRAVVRYFAAPPSAAGDPVGSADAGSNSNGSSSTGHRSEGARAEGRATPEARPPLTFGLSAPPPPPPPDPASADGGPTFFDVHLHQDVAQGCGGRIWPAAEVLGAYLARHPHFWRERWAGKEVLELGSGTGLLGLLCARMGVGGRVLITDQDAMMKLMQRNLELNEEASRAETGRGLPTPCEVRELNWGEPIPDDVPPKPEVLLLADCVYLEVAFQPLVDTMVELSTPETEILFCYQKRRKADKRFFMLLKKHFHFDHVEDDDPGRREVYNREGTQLLRVVKKR